MTKFQGAIRRLNKVIADLAANRCELGKVNRATDAAYRRARLEDNGDAACDAIVMARAGLEAAIETARNARISERNAEIKRLREEIREDNRNSPTAWMRHAG